MVGCFLKATTLAQQLLDIHAVVLQPDQPFTWSSGMTSPIYCDNRLTMSYPRLREWIATAFVDVIQEHYPEAEVIAGAATGGIPHAAWVSEKMNLPMVYVRGKAKGHGKQKQVEGFTVADKKVVVIEDLISTGGSSLEVIDGLRHEGASVLGLTAIFTYNLQTSIDALKQEDVSYKTLTDFETLIQTASLSEAAKQKLLAWYESPESTDWMT